MHMRNPAATAVKRVAQKQRKGRLSFFIDFSIYIYILKSMKNESLPFLCFCATRFTAVAARLRMCSCAPR